MMSTEARYGYPAAHAGRPVGHPIALPEWPAVRYLGRVLDEVTGLYVGVEWQAFCSAGSAPVDTHADASMNDHTDTHTDASTDTYVRVVLNLGDRPMYLFLYDQGLTLRLELPVWHGLPVQAYGFVLGTLSKRHPGCSFHLGEGASNVLVADVRFDLETSLEDLPALLPYIAGQIAGAAQDLRKHLSSVGYLESAEHRTGR